MNPQSPLVTRRLAPGTSLAQARPWTTYPVTLQSPATEVMTDLTQVKAATTTPSTSLAQAEQVMIYQGVRMLFVVSSMPSVEGLITTTDLRGERALRIVQQRGVHYDELNVADVMTYFDDIDAIAFDDLRTARVSNLIATLKRHGRNHLLIVDAEAPGAPTRVRGVVSRAQIERQLGVPIDITEVAQSFADLGRMLR